MATMTVRKASLMLECLRHCTLALIVVSVSEKMWFWILSSACNVENHPVTGRDTSYITVVELAALHHELAVGHCVALLTSRWKTLALVAGLIQIWSTAGAYDQLKLGGVAVMEELARQIQSHVDAYSDPDNVSWADSHFYTGSRRLGYDLAPSIRRHVARHIKDFMETERAQRRFRGRVWCNAAGVGGNGGAA